ncbi:hypothetical protein EMPS_08607 [Entomortierella parvispora]|uniref:Uncharacterized protein n=1 Tax=Entomortierella parvispora TaxID=205924 RepID=A0A9P3HH04_9FUNG|nr:hypothetical protein EMPS_08607 [Entomortierella parvispora]
MRPDRIDLGDGLLLRWSTKNDEANVASLMADIFMWETPTPVEDELPGRNEFVRALVHRCFRDDCRVTTAFDFALVEDTKAPKDQNPIVAGMTLQQLPGYFGKVNLSYGISEIVATHPDYRSKGLIRHLYLNLLHPASDLRGDVVQFVAGIPHFYRQFGYEYAIGVPEVRKVNDLAMIPPQPEQETIEKGGVGEPFTLRNPTLDDLPYLMKMSTPAKMLNHSELGLLYDEAYWQFWLHDALVNATYPTDINRDHWIIVDGKTGKDCGAVTAFGHGKPRMTLGMFVLEEGYNYRDAMYPVLRQMIANGNGPTVWELKQTTNESALGSSDKKRIKALCIALDPEHPINKLLESSTTLIANNFKMYTRIRSYAKFILKVASVLEDRLAKSCLADITVIWHFDFFRRIEGSTGKGLEIVFESGKIVSASDNWVPLSPHEKMMAARERIAKAKEEQRPDIKPLVYEAQFAPLTFTRLLVGDLTMDQMMSMYVECSVKEGGDHAKMMLDILFPKQQFHFDIYPW